MMKFLLSAILSLALINGAFAQARTVRAATFTAATANGTVTGGSKEVTFIFGATFTGTVGGVAFTSTDVPLRITAGYNDVLAAIPYTVAAGTVRIVQVK